MGLYRGPQMVRSLLSETNLKYWEHLLGVAYESE